MRPLEWAEHRNSTVRLGPTGGAGVDACESVLAPSAWDSAELDWPSLGFIISREQALNGASAINSQWQTQRLAPLECFR